MYQYIQETKRNAAEVLDYAGDYYFLKEESAQRK
jgi:hypothetical protein